MCAHFECTANDTERIKKEEEDVKALSTMYETVYLAKKKHFDGNVVGDIIQKMQTFIPEEHWEEVAKINRESDDDDSKSDSKLCGVCFCEYDDVWCSLPLFLFLMICGLSYLQCPSYVALHCRMRPG